MTEGQSDPPILSIMIDAAAEVEAGVNVVDFSWSKMEVAIGYDDAHPAIRAAMRMAFTAGYSLAMNVAKRVVDTMPPALANEHIAMCQQHATESDRSACAEYLKYCESEASPDEEDFSWKPPEDDDSTERAARY